MSRRSMHYPRVSLATAKHRFTGKLTYRERQELPDSAFAFPHERTYPIYNEAHAHNALARVSANGTEYQKRVVCEKVAERYPAIHEKHCTMHSR
jgi:hypothetical protein